MADPVPKFECCDISLIINESYDQLRAWLIKKTCNIELSDDITQEVMVKLVNAHNKNIFQHNPRGWLFEIARNCLVDHYRRSFQEEKYESIDLQDTKTEEVEEVSNTAADFLVPMMKLLPATYSEPLFMSDIENIPLK